MTKKKKYDEAVKKYTSAQLREAKATAKKYYKDNNGEVSVKVLARKAKVPQGYIRKWMKEEDWDEGLKEDPEDLVQLTDETKKVLRTGAEEFGLTEQEELFCYHYMKTFNATTSAIKAGYSPSYAHNKGYLLLKDERIKGFLNHVKEQRNKELFLDPLRVIQEYMKIAFADITDFIKFGPGGVVAKPSNTVDGQVIVKVKEGRDGFSIELADKMKALEKLEQYTGVMPSDWRQIISEQKLELLQQRIELEKLRLEGDEEELKKLDRLIEAIDNKAKS